MKFKLMSMLAGAITFTVAATPLTGNAQPTAPMLSQAPVSPQGLVNMPPRTGIELTEEQTAQIEEINNEAHTQIETILTEEQKEQLQTAAERRQNPQAAFASLDLSDEQKEQLREVMESTKSQMDAVLTDEQREQIEQLRQNMPQPPQLPNL